MQDQALAVRKLQVHSIFVYMQEQVQYQSARDPSIADLHNGPTKHSCQMTLHVEYVLGQVDPQLMQAGMKTVDWL